jgi:hypothetical protein
MLGHIQTAMLLCQGWFVSVDDATPRKLTPAVAGTLPVPALA